MSLNMEEFTEDQQKAITSEIDRRVTEAVKTTTAKVTENVTTQLQSEFAKTMQMEIEQAKTQASMTEEQKIEALTAQLNEQRAMFERSMLERKTESALREAGLDTDAISALMPVIVQASDNTSLEDNLNAVLTTQRSIIDKALERQQQAYASQVTPPAIGGNPGKQNPVATFNNILNNPDVDPQYAQASAIQYLLNAQQG